MCIMSHCRYCNNRPVKPWEEEKESDSEEYENGPKLCQTLSLEQLKERAGVVVFPGVEDKVSKAKPVPAAWNLPAEQF